MWQIGADCIESFFFFACCKQLDTTVNSMLAEEDFNALPANSISGVENILLVITPAGIVWLY